MSEPTQPTQAEAPSEREAFEAEMLSRGHDITRKADGFGPYNDFTIRMFWNIWQARAALATQQAGQGEAIKLDHIACIEDGELRYMTGRKAPAYDCELYAMPDGKNAPKLYTTPPAPQQPGALAQQEREPMTDAQIEKLREATFSTNNPFCPVDSKSMRKAVRAAESFHRIRAARLSEERG